MPEQVNIKKWTERMEGAKRMAIHGETPEKRALGRRVAAICEKKISVR